MSIVERCYDEYKISRTKYKDIRNSYHIFLGALIITLIVTILSWLILLPFAYGYLCSGGINIIIWTIFGFGLHIVPMGHIGVGLQGRSQREFILFTEGLLWRFPFHKSVELVDMRPKTRPLPAAIYMSGNTIRMKVDQTADWAPNDPVKYLGVDQSLITDGIDSGIHSRTQNIIGQKKWDDRKVMNNSGDLLNEVNSGMNGAVEQAGVYVFRTKWVEAPMPVSTSVVDNYEQIAREEAQREHEKINSRSAVERQKFYMDKLGLSAQEAARMDQRERNKINEKVDRSEYDFGDAKNMGPLLSIMGRFFGTGGKS